MKEKPRLQSGGFAAPTIAPSIEVQCKDPVQTRAKAPNDDRSGIKTGVVPCWRCIAFREDLPLGCAVYHATRATKPKRVTADQTSMWSKE